MIHIYFILLKVYSSMLTLGIFSINKLFNNVRLEPKRISRRYRFDLKWKSVIGK